MPINAAAVFEFSIILYDIVVYHITRIIQYYYLLSQVRAVYDNIFDNVAGVLSVPLAANLRLHV